MSHSTLSQRCNRMITACYESHFRIYSRLISRDNFWHDFVSVDVLTASKYGLRFCTFHWSQIDDKPLYQLTIICVSIKTKKLTRGKCNFRGNGHLCANIYAQQEAELNDAEKQDAVLRLKYVVKRHRNYLIIILQCMYTV